MKRALEHELLSVNFNCCFGIILFSACRYDEAIKQFQISIKIDSNFSLHQYWLGRVYLEKRMFKQAWEMLNKATSFPAIHTLSLGALAYHPTLDFAPVIVSSLCRLKHNREGDFHGRSFLLCPQYSR